MTEAANFPCPCWGYLVFDEPPGSWAICAVCGWEDDLSQLRFPTVGGANRSLIECQQEFSAHGKPASLECLRDARWRPLDLAIDQVEVPMPGQDYGPTYSQDPTAYYFWRT